MSHFRPKEVLLRAQAAEKAGNYKEASHDFAFLSIYLRRKSKFPESKKMMDHAIHLSPQSTRLYLQRALCEFALNQDAAARRSVTEFTRRAVERQRVHSYLPYVEKHLESLPVLREVFFASWLTLDRTSVDPFLGLSEALKAQGKFEEAKQFLLDALLTDKENPRPINALQGLLESQGNQTAVGYCLRFRKGDLNLEEFLLLQGGKTPPPSSPPVPLKLTRDPEELKDLGDLVRELEKELEMDSHSQYSDLEPVAQEFRRRSDAIVGEHTKTRIDLACAFLEMGRTQDAKEELAKIPSDDPLYAEAQCLVGETLIQEGTDLAALGAFQSCLRAAGNNLKIAQEALYQMAQVYYRLSDFAGAMNCIEKLEKTDPNYRSLRDLKRKMT